MLRQALDRRRFEEVPAVLPGPGEAPRRLGQGEREVELRDPPLPGDRGEGKAGQLQGARGRVLKCEEDLEERCPAGVASRREDLDHLLEGYVLVGVREERGRPDPDEELPELRVSREIRAENEEVDKEADQPLALAPGAVGDGRADRQVLLARHPPEQCREAREEGHEESRALGTGELGQSVAELAREGEPHQAAAPRPLRRPGMVGGEIERGETRQRLPPVGDLPFQQLARQLLPLPEGEVRVLHRELRQRRGPALQEGAIERSELLHHHADRPAVGDDVMEGEEGPVLLFAGADEHDPEERPAGEVERQQGLLPGQPHHLRLAPGRRNPLEVDPGYRHLQRGLHRGDRLHRPAARRDLEGRPQHGMPAHDLAQGRGEDLRFEPPRDLEGRRHVVGRAPGFELVQKPQPLLSERER